MTNSAETPQGEVSYTPPNSLAELHRRFDHFDQPGHFLRNVLFVSSGQMPIPANEQKTLYDKTTRIGQEKLAAIIDPALYAISTNLNAGSDPKIVAGIIQLFRWIGLDKNPHFAGPIKNTIAAYSIASLLPPHPDTLLQASAKSETPIASESAETDRLVVNVGIGDLLSLPQEMNLDNLTAAKAALTPQQVEKYLRENPFQVLTLYHSGLTYSPEMRAVIQVANRRLTRQDVSQYFRRYPERVLTEPVVADLTPTSSEVLDINNVLRELSKSISVDQVQAILAADPYIGLISLRSDDLPAESSDLLAESVRKIYTLNFLSFLHKNPNQILRFLPVLSEIPGYGYSLRQKFYTIEGLLREAIDKVDFRFNIPQAATIPPVADSVMNALLAKDLLAEAFGTQTANNERLIHQKIEQVNLLARQDMENPAGRILLESNLEDLEKILAGHPTGEALLESIRQIEQYRSDRNWDLYDQSESQLLARIEELAGITPEERELRAASEQDLNDFHKNIDFLLQRLDDTNINSAENQIIARGIVELFPRYQQSTIKDLQILEQILHKINNFYDQLLGPAGYKISNGQIVRITPKT